MTSEEADFAVALERIFGERAEGFSDELRSLLRELWRSAVVEERRQIFKYVQQSVSLSEDPQDLCRLSWTIANGTYRTSPNLSARPPWMADHDAWVASVAERLVPRRDASYRGEGSQWQVYMHDVGFIALLTLEEGKYRVWHEPEDPNMMAEIRYFASWSAAMADVAARRAVHERSREQRAEAPASECKTFKPSVQVAE